MKKIILTALVAVATLSANAQVYVGGNLGFQGRTNKNVKDENVTKSTFTVSPEVGYSFNEKWDAGIALNMQFMNKNQLKTKNLNGKQGSFIGGEIYGRYNYVKTGIASLFVELAAGFTANRSYIDSEGKQYYKNDKIEDGEEARTGTIFGFGFRPGVKIALSDKVSLVAKTGLIGAQFANSKAQKNGYDKTSFGIGVNNSDLSLGVYYSF